MSRNQTNEELLEKRKSQARARRYKKPMLKSINLDAIHDFIREEGAAAEKSHILMPTKMDLSTRWAGMRRKRLSFERRLACWPRILKHSGMI